MKKHKEWLKKEVQQIQNDGFYFRDNYSKYDQFVNVEDLIPLIDQLDEPETLSQEWIDENKVARINDLRKMTTNDVVPVEKLKNLLAPKQDDGFVVFEKDKLDEEVQRMIDETYKTMNEKPVIPKFVTDWDYDKKEDALADSIHSTRYSLEANYWKLIDRVRCSYEAEEEKLYHVKDNNETLLCKVKGVVMTVAKAWYIGYEQEFYHLTEKEIKDYDERYWVFAEEVTE